jgi:hypothetical protein
LNLRRVKKSSRRNDEHPSQACVACSRDSESTMAYSGEPRQVVNLICDPAPVECLSHPDEDAGLGA